MPNAGSGGSVRVVVQVSVTVGATLFDWLLSSTVGGVRGGLTRSTDTTVLMLGEGLSAARGVRLSMSVDTGMELVLQGPGIRPNGAVGWK